MAIDARPITARGVGGDIQPCLEDLADMHAKFCAPSIADVACSRSKGYPKSCLLAGWPTGANELLFQVGEASGDDLVAGGPLRGDIEPGLLFHERVLSSESFVPR